MLELMKSYNTAIVFKSKALPLSLVTTDYVSEWPSSLLVKRSYVTTVFCDYVDYMYDKIQYIEIKLATFY